jgi:hypothetical protein
MPKFQITVRRIIREDISIEVEAEDRDAAREQAQLKATSRPPEQWEIYDCEYWTETHRPRRGLVGQGPVRQGTARRGRR